MGESSCNVGGLIKLTKTQDFVILKITRWGQPLVAIFTDNTLSRGEGQMKFKQ